MKHEFMRKKELLAIPTAVTLALGMTACHSEAASTKPDVTHTVKADETVYDIVRTTCPEVLLADMPRAIFEVDQVNPNLANSNNNIGVGQTFVIPAKACEVSK